MMTETKRNLLLIIALGSLFMAGVVWFGMEPHESAINIWVWRIGTIGVFAGSTFAFFHNYMRQEKAPDLLRMVDEEPFEISGVCFSISPSFDDGVVALKVLYQNRFSGPAKMTIRLKPRRISMIRKAVHGQMNIEVAMGPGEFGYAMVPMVLPDEARGQKLRWRLAGKTIYPEGRKELLRFNEGRTVSSIRGRKEVLITLAGLLTGRLFLYQWSRYELEIPEDFALRKPPDMRMTTHPQWRLEDEQSFDKTRLHS